MSLTVDLPDEVIERIVERAAELAAERSVTAEPSGFIDVPGAAEFLACPTSRIYSMVSARRIPFHKDGSRLLFDRDELREYVRNGGAVRS